jgi:hypothetical protein
MCPQEFGDRHTEKLLRQKDSLGVMAQCAVPEIGNDLLCSKSRATIRCGSRRRLQARRCSWRSERYSSCRLSLRTPVGRTGCFGGNIATISAII